MAKVQTMLKAVKYSIIGGAEDETDIGGLPVAPNHPHPSFHQHPYNPFLPYPYFPYTYTPPGWRAQPMLSANTPDPNSQTLLPIIIPTTIEDNRSRKLANEDRKNMVAVKIIWDHELLLPEASQFIHDPEFFTKPNSNVHHENIGHAIILYLVTPGYHLWHLHGKCHHRDVPIG
ncbi:hypothetical protein VP01_2365g4 [Puccinia sorghi]|uniref:Uncharacterized protein n=1 Tax=Puccinia sorghi TaxID=27349 RepID=A0A0L6V731_9BASI|nr:hypothetical protein VP01_2365g4 [Puccinia sorghi]